MGSVVILRRLVLETVALMENFAVADRYVINRFDIVSIYISNTFFYILGGNSETNE